MATGKKPLKWNVKDLNKLVESIQHSLHVVRDRRLSVNDSINVFEVYTPEQCEKSIGFNDHANNGPTQQHDDNSSKEGCCAFNFMALKEKS